MYISTPSSSPSSILNHATADSVCGFEGNNDIYGIGIRIGIYAQILAVWFANYFLLSEAQVLRDSVSIFSVAILIVALIYASNPTGVYAVEAFVLLQILAWSCMTGVRAKSSYNKATFSRGSFLRRVMCEIVNLVNICLHVWFWWAGLDHMKKTPCGTWLMMYVVKTDLFGWARKVMMAMSLFVLLCTIYWMVLGFLKPWTSWKVKEKRRQFVEAVRAWEESRGQNFGEEDVEGKNTVPGEGTGMQDTSKQKSSHDECSRALGSRCLPTRSDFGHVRPFSLVRTRSDPLAQRTAGWKHFSRLSHEGNSTRSSLITVQEVPSPTTLTSLSSSHTNTSVPQSLPDLSIIQEVYESERYIQQCVTASPYQMSSDGKPLTFPVIARSILFPKKYRSATAGKPAPPSWFHCQLNSYIAFLTCRFPPQAFVIYSHLRQAHLLDPLNGPFQTYAAITYTSAPSTPDVIPPWTSVSLASSLLLTNPAMPKKIWLGWYYAILDLLIHVIVILQLELTLHWNHVSGLSGLWTSVGQLIPFIIGVGGLGLVITRWMVRMWVKRVIARGEKSGWEVDVEEDEKLNEDVEEYIVDGLKGGRKRMQQSKQDQTDDVCWEQGQYEHINAFTHLEAT
ncbi:hypothetical protein BKA58DRAFT_226724 [Alternaria rosae]|uniref:uncharacterized protein n=1 Tax=Alternaria rosae TaxID=1187941 RepID=UPI001E8CBAFB|nr:uncharacterized protein BKA58DRAFT_226724 [Alternaria rosae]KAH6865753.1 hypothetical protein BKA58DRAFT_226724 [Alternaria rosae]